MSRHIKRENVHLSIYKPNLITPTESYGRFEPGGVLDVAILAQSKCKAPKMYEVEVDSVNHSEVIMIQTQRIFITLIFIQSRIICDGPFSWKLSHIHVHVHACTYIHI